MMTRKALLLPVALLVASVTACDRRPDYVISQDDMVDLLVDLHKAEGVVELNRTRYATDSMRMVMKQSVLARHGVTRERFDTSMVWYGHNIEKYIELYDDVIARLESEAAAVDADQGGARVNMAVVGDSADAWPDARMRRFFYGQADNMVRFSLRRDENWEQGDVYTWKFYLSNMRTPLQYAIATQYSDGTADYQTGSTSAGGWNNVVLQLDTARTATHVFGYAMLAPGPDEAPYMDSVSLVRTRFSPDTYSLHPLKNWTNRAPKRSEEE